MCSATLLEAVGDQAAPQDNEDRHEGRGQAQDLQGTVDQTSSNAGAADEGCRGVGAKRRKIEEGDGIRNLAGIDGRSHEQFHDATGLSGCGIGLSGESYEDGDPFDYGNLGFDEGQAGSPPNQRMDPLPLRGGAAEEGEAHGHVSTAAVAAAEEGDARHEVRDDGHPEGRNVRPRIAMEQNELGGPRLGLRVCGSPPVEQDHGDGLAGGGAQGTARGSASLDEGLTKSQRRKMVLENLAESRKRRRLELAALQKAWGGLTSAIGIDDWVEIETHETQPPASVHATHALITCGGYLGCARCGRVVGWNGLDHLNTPCRGSCPRGSVRAIRRLAKGLHPYQRDNAPPLGWPSGETKPTPRRM